jgi:transposase
VPASLRVEVRVRPKNACKRWQGQSAIAAWLLEPIEQWLPGARLTSPVIIITYVDYMPLYCQEWILIRRRATLSRSTLCDWMASCSSLMEPIWKAMNRRILFLRVIETDDSHAPVHDHT